ATCTRRRSCGGGGRAPPAACQGGAIATSAPTASSSRRPRIAVTQGDPAGIGPELLLKLAAAPARPDAELLFLAEHAALESVRALVPQGWERLQASIELRDPVGERRTVTPGQPGAADA